MQTGIFAKTFSGAGVRDVMRKVHAAGYETAQFNMACAGLAPMPDAIDPAAAGVIKQACRAEGIGLAAISATYNMIHPDMAVRRAGMRRLTVMMGAAKACGARLLTLCTGSRDASDQWRHHPDNQSGEAWADLIAEMEIAAELAESHDVFLGVEPELANAVNSTEAAVRLLGQVGSSRIRIIFDAANLFEKAGLEEQRRLISDGIDALGERIAMAHIKDKTRDGRIVAAGDGTVDFPHLVGRLRSVGFDGPLVTHGLGQKDAARVSLYLKELTSK